MRTRFNDELLLWAIATLQPASCGDARAFIKNIFPEINAIPIVKELETTIGRWVEQRYVIRVHGKSRLYSLTLAGNHKLSVALRRHRDKTRLFLLKAARDASVPASGETRQELGGDSPPVDGSSKLQEGSRPISLVEAPRGPRTPDQTYWPRVIKQLDFKVGSAPRSPDTQFEYHSFASVAAIHQANSHNTLQDDDLSITDLGLAIGVSPRLLTSFLHKPHPHYRTFWIGKRGGGNRLISSPRTFLKVIQYWLLDYFLFKLPVHQNCHAYRRAHSILTNALPHVGKNFVGNIDIEDYFGSITQGRIETLLRGQGFGPNLSNSISRLITLDDKLPQGAPTSPVVSNAVLYDFDQLMTTYAVEQELVYTRYADDITLSGGRRLAIEKAIRYAGRMLQEFDLVVNVDKTRIASQSGQQKVTGVVVNSKAQPPRKYRRMVRALFHRAEIEPAEYRDRLAELNGHVSYLQSYPELKHHADLDKYRKVIDRVRSMSSR